MDDFELNKNDFAVSVVRDESVSNEAENMVLNGAEGKLPLNDVKEDTLVTHEGDFALEPEDTGDDLQMPEEFAKIKYLSNEENLEIPSVNADMIDDDAPFESINMAGKWLREAFNLKNYWQGIERLGEDVASYKWAYDQGEMGEFDGKAFTIEAMKAGLRSLGQNSLQTAGNMLSMFGANLANRSMPTTIMTSGAGLMMPEVGKVYQDIGKTLRSYADEVENISFLAGEPAGFSEEPSWSKLANVVGSGSAQVLAMGGMARLVGAGATYGLFASGGAGEVFKESLEKDGDVEKANTLAAMNAGVTFAIDKLLDPLPETVAKNAKLTSKKVAQEMVGAPLREAGSEVLQQMLAENLVRQVGIDDTADLFEGLLESALGAFAGSSVLSSSAGGVYLARKNLDESRRKIMLKGVSAEELELYQKNMMAFMESKPEAFEKILGANLKENLRQMDLAARQIKNRKERAEKRDDIKAFDAVYEEMYQRFFDALGDEAKAKAAAKMFEANAISLYKYDHSLSPKKLLDGLLPKIEKTDIASFLARKLPEEAVSYSLIGVNAKHANMSRLTTALNLEKKGADAQLIWQKTGWHKGGDGKWRMEISDKDAFLIPWKGVALKEKVKTYFDESKKKVEATRAYLAAVLKKTAEGKYGAFYLDFYDYLHRNYKEPLSLTKTPENEQIGAYNLLDILDKAKFKRRKAEEFVLADLVERYREMYADKKETATLNDAFAELEKNKGKSFDFTEEEYKYVMGALDHNYKLDFFKRYWDKSTGKLRYDEFQKMAQSGEAEYGVDAAFSEELSAVAAQTAQRREERLGELKRLNVEPTSFYFADIDRDEAYKTYRVYQGDFGVDKLPDGGDDYLPESYKKTLQPISLAEKFLDQEQYAYLRRDEKLELTKYLNKVERIYGLQRYLDDADVYQGIGKDGMDMLPLDSDEGLKLQRAVQEEMMYRLEGEFTLKDFISHPALYDNYPEVASMVVRFGKLVDNAPYHTFFDEKDGYVLEIDPEQLNGQNMKEIFLKGAMFAVQDIEGFDYTLTKEQRRNFMNRQIYQAARDVQGGVVNALEMFADKFLPDVNYQQFLVRQHMPLSLMRLNQSADLRNPDKPQKPYRAHFWEVDYEKLTEAVMEKYRHPAAEEGYSLRDLAYAELQNLQNLNANMLMTAARANGGYGATLMPWAGATSQGAMDERALVARQDFSEAELRKSPFFEDWKGERLALPETMDAYDEFAAKISRDVKNYRETLQHLAEGAYTFTEPKISIFEAGDAKTIVHETFHYFWDMVHSIEGRRESFGADFFDVMGELREEFATLYRVREVDGKWYAFDKDTGKRARELMRGFNSQKDVVDAGVRELFVAHFMAMLNNRVYSKNVGSFGRAVDFYSDWLRTVTDTLGVTADKMTPDGGRLLNFLTKKVK